jgi:type IV secretion system protein VirB1
MPLDADIFLALARTCAPQVAPTTLLAVARAESGLDPLAIGVNGPGRGSLRPRSRDEAVAAARKLMAQGRDLDLGLGQINVRNLRPLGLSVEAAFDPCRNLQAAGTVLAAGYRRGVAEAGPGQRALRIAFSVYNTGHIARGFANGYVARVAGASKPPPSGPAPIAPSPPPAWDSFGAARRAWATSDFMITPTGATP